MAYLSYVSHDIEEPLELVAAIRNRRHGSLLNLDRMLLNSPEFAEGWNYFLDTVRNKLTISPLFRELAICVVAVLNRADYEFIQHAPVFLEAGGTHEQLEAIRSIGIKSGWESNFSEEELAIIQLTREMTTTVKVSEDTLQKAYKIMGNTKLTTEMVGVIATYNMVSRYLVALGIEPEEE